MTCSTMPPTTPGALLLSVRRWVYKLALRYARKYDLDADDVAGQAAVAVLRRFREFDPARGTPCCFAAFLVRDAACRMTQTDRLVRGGGRRCPVEVRDVNAYADRDPGPASALVEREAEAGVRAKVVAMLATLNPVDRALVVRWFGLFGEPARTLRELAAEIGVSNKRVQQRVARALASLRGEIPETRPRRVRPAPRPAAPCRHCAAAPGNRSRGLCWRCYGTPGVRDGYASVHPCGRRADWSAAGGRGEAA